MTIRSTLSFTKIHHGVKHRKVAIMGNKDKYTLVSYFFLYDKGSGQFVCRMTRERTPYSLSYRHYTNGGRLFHQAQISLQYRKIDFYSAKKKNTKLIYKCRLTRKSMFLSEFDKECFRYLK